MDLRYLNIYKYIWCLFFSLSSFSFSWCPSFSCFFFFFLWLARGLKTSVRTTGWLIHYPLENLLGCSMQSWYMFFLTPRPPGQSFCSSGPSQEIGSTEQFDPNILLLRSIPLIRVQPGPWERDREQPATRPNGRFDGGCTCTYSSSCGSLTETLAVVIPNSPPTSDLHAWRLFAPLWSFSVFVELEIRVFHPMTQWRKRAWSLMKPSLFAHQLLAWPRNVIYYRYL